MKEKVLNIKDTAYTVMMPTELEEVTERYSEAEIVAAICFQRERWLRNVIGANPRDAARHVVNITPCVR